MFSGPYTCALPIFSAFLQDGGGADVGLHFMNKEIVVRATIYLFKRARYERHRHITWQLRKDFQQSIFRIRPFGSLAHRIWLPLLGAKVGYFLWPKAVEEKSGSVPLPFAPPFRAMTEQARDICHANLQFLSARARPVFELGLETLTSID